MRRPSEEEPLIPPFLHPLSAEKASAVSLHPSQLGERHRWAVRESERARERKRKAEQKERKQRERGRRRRRTGNMGGDTTRCGYTVRGNIRRNKQYISKTMENKYRSLSEIIVRLVNEVALNFSAVR